MTPAVLLAVIINILVWGAAFPGIRAALVSYSPGELGLLRYIIASLVLLAYAQTGRVRKAERDDLPRLFLLGLTGVALYNVLVNLGEVTVEAAAAAFLVNLGPVFTVLLATLFLKERTSVIGWLGIFISLTGALLIARAESGNIRLDIGALWLACAAVCQSIFFVMQKPLLRRYTPIEVVSYAIWFGTLCMGVFMLTLPGAIADAQPAATVAVIFLGVFPGAIGYIAYSYVLSAIPASQAASFLYFVPIVALFVGWVWLGEVPPAAAVGGGFIVFIGVFIVRKWGQQPKLAR